MSFLLSFSGKFDTCQILHLMNCLLLSGCFCWTIWTSFKSSPLERDWSKGTWCRKEEYCFVNHKFSFSVLKRGLRQANLLTIILTFLRQERSHKQRELKFSLSRDVLKCYIRPELIKARLLLTAVNYRYMPKKHIGFNTSQPMISANHALSNWHQVVKCS